MTSSPLPQTWSFAALLAVGASAPLLEHSVRSLAAGMLLFLNPGFFYWTLYKRLRPPARRLPSS